MESRESSQVKFSDSLELFLSNPSKLDWERKKDAFMTSTENNNDSSTIVSTNQQQFTNHNYVTEFISTSLNNRIIPKIGSIIKRFSLNYSGEGLVTDRERLRVVHVGIRFQVQVDSFLNRGAVGRPRATLTHTYAPELSDCDNHTNRENTRPLVGSQSVNNSTSANFLDRINALNLRNSHNQRDNQHSIDSQQSYPHIQHNLYIEERFKTDQGNIHHPRMEDSSSYQVLRHFPGSNVTSFRELNWETAAFEQQVRKWVLWVGEKATSSRLPPVVQGVLNSAKRYAKDNPLTAITFLTLLATCAIPIVSFMAFAVATILVTFMGFLFIEGTVLTAATVVLGSVLIVVALATLFVLVVGLFAYFCTSQVFNLFKGHISLFRILCHIPIIWHLFRNLEHSERNGSSNNCLRNNRQNVGDDDCEYEEEVSIPYEIDEDHDGTFDRKANKRTSTYANGDAPNQEILSHTD